MLGFPDPFPSLVLTWMIEQQGRVVGVGPARATVVLGGSTGCASCDAGKGCGAGIFGRLVGRRPVALDLDNHLPLVPGQAVVVGIPEAIFLRLLGRFYLLPLMAGLLGAILGHALAVSLGWQGAVQDLLALLGALIFAAVTLLTHRNSEPLQLNDRVVQILGYPVVQPDQLCPIRPNGRPDAPP